MKRRTFLTLSAGGVLGSSLSEATKATTIDKKRYQSGTSPWPICLDTATIRPASLHEKIEIAHEAGYDAIEPWDMELREFEEKGGNLTDLRKKIKDLGMFVPSVIGLWNALPPTQEEWELSLPDTRERMRMAAEIGSEHIQTIPNTVGEHYDTLWVANRYRDIIEIGINDYDIKPAIVFVKFFPLKTLGESVAVALNANHPEAKIIPDTFHMHISQGGFEGLKLLNGDMIAIFQFADAPASPGPNDLQDSQRVYPGDGVLPLAQSLRDLYATGFKGCVSLELYNPNYYEQNLLEVAKIGLQKTLAVINEAEV